MTPEEQAERKRLEEVVERKRLERKVEQQRAARRQQAAAEPEFDANWKDRVEMVTQGATFNLGDEIYSGLAAVGGEIKDVFSDDEGRTLGSRFRDKHQALNARREQYRRANPGEALALELAGGLSTGGVGLGRALAKQGLSHGARMMRGVGVGAGEGAIAGFGSSAGDLEDRLQSAAGGAAIGAGTAGVLGAGGAALRGLSRRRLDKDIIDEKGRVTPIPLADETGPLGSLYRQGVRRIWGAQQNLDDQAQWIIDPAERRLARAQALKEGRAGQVEPARQAAEDAGTAAQRQFEDAAAVRLDEQAKTIERRAAAADRQFKQGAEGVDRQVAKRVDAEVEADRAAFRKDAARRAVPDYAPDELKLELEGLAPEQASKRLKSWWSNNGFEAAKRQPISWDKQFTEDLKFLVGEEPALGRAVYKDVITQPGMRPQIEQVRAKLAADAKVKPEDISVEDTVKKILETPHTMSGETFMTVRNTFARNANNATDGWKRKAMRDVVEGFDKKIEGTLEGDDLKEFLADKARYRDFVHYRDTVKDAFDADGLFTEKNWLKVARKNTEAPAVGQARGLSKTIARRAADAEGEVARRKSTLQKALDKAKAEQETANAALKKARKAASRGAADAGKAAKRQSPALKKAKAAKKRADKRASSAKTELERLKKLRGPEESSGLSALLTTMVAGSMATGGLFAAGGAGAALAGLAGVRAGNFLTRPKVQQAIAGQSKTQERLARQLRGTRAQIAPAAIRRTAAAQAGNYDSLEDE